MKNDENISRKAAEEVLGEYACRVGEDDVRETLGKEDEVRKLFKRVKVLSKYLNDLCEIFELLRDRVTATYKETPWRVVAALVGALLYVLSPLDLFLDFLPIIGYLDDAVVVGLVIEFAQADLDRYRVWKAARKEMAA